MIYVGNYGAWGSSGIYVGNNEGLGSVPEIVSISELRALGTLVITLSPDSGGITEVTVNGVSVSPITTIDATHVSCPIPKSVGVLPGDSVVSVVVSNEIGPSDSIATTFYPVQNYSYVTAAAAFYWANGSASGDYCCWETPIEYEGEFYDIVINEYGEIDFGEGAPVGMYTNVYFYDVSQNNAATATQQVSVGGFDSVVAPILPSDSTIQINEGSTIVGNFSALVGTPIINYSITGTDAGQFTINSSTAILSFTSPPSFASPTDANSDNTYLVTVVGENIGGSSETDLQIVVLESVAIVSPPTGPIKSSSISVRLVNQLKNLL